MDFQGTEQGGTEPQWGAEAHLESVPNCAQNNTYTTLFLLLSPKPTIKRTQL